MAKDLLTRTPPHPINMPRSHLEQGVKKVQGAVLIGPPQSGPKSTPTAHTSRAPHGTPFRPACVPAASDKRK
jgi:hypothetical protein